MSGLLPHNRPVKLLYWDVPFLAENQKKFAFLSRKALKKVLKILKKS